MVRIDGNGNVEHLDCDSTAEKGFGRISFKDEINTRAKELIKDLNFDYSSFGVRSNTLSFKKAVIDNLYSTGQKPKVIGFVFVSSVDIKVPVMKLKRHAVDRYDVEGHVKYRSVKAGEEFCLNYVETAILMSFPEYDCLVTGGGISVELRMNASNKFADRPIPQLRIVENEKGSTKLADYACDVTDEAGVVKDEFEATFGDYIVDTHKRRVKVSVKKKEQIAKRAAMSELFRSSYIQAD